MFFVLPTRFAASVFLVAIASGIPVAILTSPGVSAVNRRLLRRRTTHARRGRAVLDLEGNGARVVPQVLVGLFMALYYSLAVLLVAEMLGAKYGLGWCLAFETGYSAYANVYATLAIMALLCSGIVKPLFVGRDRLLSWQRGFV